MGQKLLRIRKQSGEILWAYARARGTELLATRATHLADVITERPPVSGTVLKEGEYDILSPITAPCQVICQGKNYLDHLKETGLKPADKEFNLLFSKAASTLTSAFGSIKKPPQVALLDYEIELGLVIGAPLTAPTKISTTNLSQYIVGIVMCNDISARDVQVPQRQWFKGKSFRGFCPVGPWIYLLDPGEIDVLQSLELELRVNEKVRQKTNTAKMIYGPAETLQEISEIFDLYPGDLILTGTPGGVAMRVPPKNKWQELMSVWVSDKEKMQRFVASQKESGRYLQQGDKISSTIRSADGRIDLGEQVLYVE